MTEHTKPFSRRATLAAMVLLYVVWSLLFIWKNSIVAIDNHRYFFLLDDAMISMRYAWNLAHGHGLVWNPGERVEGITNLLMTLYMAIPALVLGKVAAVLFVELSGIAFLIAMAVLCAKIAPRLTDADDPNRNYIATLAFLAPIAYFPLPFWTLLGMETGLLTLLLFVAVWMVLRERQPSQRSPWLGVVLGLMFLTRPDAVIPAALILVYYATRFQGRTNQARAFVYQAAILGGFIVLTTAFRWIYYGSPVPNTYTLKIVGMPLLFRLANGWGYLQPFLGTIWLATLIAALGLVTNWRINAALLFGLFLASIAYQDWTGGDPWIYWRMMTPTVPLLLILCLVELAAFLRRLFHSAPIRGYLARNPILSPAVLERTAIAGAMLGLLLTVNRAFLPQAMLTELPPLMVPYRHEVNIAVALNQITKPTATIGVFKAGISPYYTGRRAIDFLGKCDKYIASLPPDLTGAISYYGMRSVPGHNKYDLQYSIGKLQPTYIAGKQRGTDDMNAFVEQHYVLVDHKGVDVLLKKNSPNVLWNRIHRWDWRNRLARTLGQTDTMELTPQARAWTQSRHALFDCAFTNSLDGWKTSSSWQAANGYLSGQGTIDHANDHTNFEFLVSYCLQTTPDQNCRALIHLLWNKKGYSIRLSLFPDKAILDQICDSGYSRLAVNGGVCSKAGQWYTIYAKLDGPHIAIWRAPLNGKGKPILTANHHADFPTQQILLGGAGTTLRYDDAALLVNRASGGN